MLGLRSCQFRFQAKGGSCAQAGKPVNPTKTRQTRRSPAHSRHNIAGRKKRRSMTCAEEGLIRFPGLTADSSATSEPIHLTSHPTTDRTRRKHPRTPRFFVGASLLAMNLSPPRCIRFAALSLTTIASRLAPTVVGGQFANLAPPSVPLNSYAASSA